MACAELVYKSDLVFTLYWDKSYQVFTPSLISKTHNTIRSRTCNVYLLYSYVPLQLLKPLQNRSNPFLDSCQSKARVKIWGQETYIGELHAVPTKFIDKLLSFH